MRDRIALIAFLAPLTIYLLSLCPSVFVGDSGELITAARELGIVQPTGFPLYMVLGKLLTLVPAGTVAARVNLLSALASSVTALAAYGIIALAWPRPLALAGALLVATSRTLWAQSVVARTYPLTQAFLAVEFYLALVLLRQAPGRRRFLALCLITGLSSGTHLLFVLFVPVLVVLGVRECWSRRLLGVALLSLGVSQYAYIPIQARPGIKVYNVFGTVTGPRQFVEYLTESGYREKQFSRSAANLVTFFKRLGMALATQTTPLALPLIAWGLVAMRRREPRALALGMLCGIGNLFILVAYGDDRDIYFLDRYFLWIDFFLAIALAFGLGALMEWLHAARGPAAARVGACAVGALLLYGAAGARATADRSHTLVPVAFGHALLDPLPSRAVLFVAGDSPMFVCDYLQRCEGVRTDVGVVTSERFASLVERLTHLAHAPPIFTDFQPSDLPRDVRTHPYGLVWTVERVATAGPPPSPHPRSTPDPRTDPFSDPMGHLFASDPAYTDYETAALGAQYWFVAGLTALTHGHDALANSDFDRALAIAPENRLVRYNLARVMAGRGERTRALSLLDQALQLDLESSSDPTARSRWIALLGLGPR